MSTPESSIAQQLAAFLLEVEAVRLRPDEPFKWSSGWNSPIYCDNRITLSYPRVRTYIKQELAQMVQRLFPEADAIAGVATAGIAQGALVADLLKLPFAYVRPEPKKHGTGNQIEGQVKPGQRVVLIEDLISTGGSSLKAAEALRAAGVEVLGLLAIFTYGFAEAEANFALAELPYYALSNYQELLRLALGRGLINEQTRTQLEKWRKSPGTWPADLINAQDEAS